MYATNVCFVYLKMLMLFYMPKQAVSLKTVRLSGISTRGNHFCGFDIYVWINVPCIICSGG